MKFAFSIAAACMSLLAQPAAAQAVASEPFPNKPVRIVVPFPPGGASDIVARVLALKLSEIWQSSVVVENRPGASGTIAGEFVRKAPADGYTLLLAGPSNTTALAAVNPKMIPYDPVKDFKAVSIAVTFPHVVAVNPELGIKSLPDLIKAVKANPGKYSYASSGTGTTTHLFVKLFKSMAGLYILHVPYPGSAPGLNAVMAGHVSMSMDPINVVTPLVKSARLVALAVTSAARNAEMPDVPTVGETVKGFVVDSWVALLSPPETPDPIVRKIAADLRTAVQSPEVVKRFRDIGLTSVGSTPEAAQENVKTDLDRWQRVVKVAGIKAE